VEHEIKIGVSLGWVLAVFRWVCPGISTLVIDHYYQWLCVCLVGHTSWPSVCLICPSLHVSNFKLWKT